MQTPRIGGEKILKEGRFLTLKELELIHPDDKRTPYEVVTRNAKKVIGIVSILPITRENEIVMIRQYRAPLNRVQLELPAGCAEVGKHTSLEDAVQSELREETGYEAGVLQHIAVFSSSSGMTSETVHGYVAENCRKITDILSLDSDEYIERILVPISDFDELIFSEISRGSIIEPKMLAMMWWFRNLFAKKEIRV